MNARKLILKVHLVLSLAAGAVLVLAGLTGSALVFREEIDRALDPSVHQAPRPAHGNSAKASLAAVLERVRRAHPEHRPMYVRMPRVEGGSYEFWIDAPDGRLVYADPYTGGVLGSRVPGETLTGWLHDLHVELLLGEAGHTVQGVAGLALVALTVTGALLWWPGVRHLGRGFRVSWRAPWKRVNYDLHKAVGAVGAPLLFVAGLTGAALVFHEAARWALDGITASPPAPKPPASTPRGSGTDHLAPADIDAAIAAAAAVLPRARTTWVYLPEAEDDAFTIRLKLPEEAHPNGSNFVYVDRYSGRVLRADLTPQQSAGARAFNLLYPSHTGVVWGLPGRLLGALAGVLPLVLLTTGLILWRSRWRRKRPAGVVSGPHHSAD